MMKKTLFSAILGMLIITSCSKSTDPPCTNVSLQQDDQVIASYIAANSIVGFTKDASNVYYKVINPGAAPYVNSGSRIFIKYIGKLLDANATIFDQAATPVGPYPSTGFVVGFQVALTKIGKGGKVQVYIPSNLAYGCVGAGSIPANACVYFDIDLVDVQ